MEHPALVQYLKCYKKIYLTYLFHDLLFFKNFRCTVFFMLLYNLSAIHKKEEISCNYDGYLLRGFIYAVYFGLYYFVTGDILGPK